MRINSVLLIHDGLIRQSSFDVDSRDVSNLNKTMFDICDITLYLFSFTDVENILKKI